MKKLIFAVAALGLFFTSCSKSNDALIEEYAKLGQEAVEAVKNNDQAKAEQIEKEGNKLDEELKSRTLTDEEKAKLDSVQSKIMEDMAAAVQEKMGAVSDMFE